MLWLLQIKTVFMVRKKPLTDKHKILSLGEHSILDKKIKRKEEEQKKNAFA